MSRRRARGRLGWNVLGIVIFVVLVFPVFWMLSTSLKDNDQISSFTPTWFPRHPTLQHFADAIHRQYFWTDVGNSAIVVLATVAIALVLSFLAAIALAKYGFSGRNEPDGFFRCVELATGKMMWERKEGWPKDDRRSSSMLSADRHMTEAERESPWPIG